MNAIKTLGIDLAKNTFSLVSMNKYGKVVLRKHPAMDRQKLRQLQRQAAKEKASEKTGKYYRELFAYLKEHVKK